jgi:hypothetical protein
LFSFSPQGPTGAAATSSQLTGSSEMYFEGVIYLPRQSLTLTGGAEAYSPSPYTGFIADTFDISGNGSMVINNDTTRTNVPIPVALQVAAGGRPKLVQ